MPEGDTIHKIAAAMQPLMLGKVLRQLVLNPRGGVAESGERFEGCTVEAVYAHGKHLLIHLGSRDVLRVHLGMHGSWHRYRPDEAWRRPKHLARVVLDVTDDVLVCFNANEVEVLATAGIRSSNLFNRLGRDLLDPSFDAAEAVARARSFNPPDTALCDILLDQRAACGIGNVYKSEVLFVQRLNPRDALGSTDDTQLEQAYECASELLAANVGGGRRVTRLQQARNAGGLWVYGRKDQPCYECAEPISYARLGRGWRSTYWCGQCQRMGLHAQPAQAVANE